MILLEAKAVIVRSTISMCSMVMLGGLGHALQKNKCSEIESEGISESQNNCKINAIVYIYYV